MTRRPGKQSECAGALFANDEWLAKLQWFSKGMTFLEAYKVGFANALALLDSAVTD
jgi:hypothetical protein